MKFSNPTFFDIAPEDFAAQQEQLADLRDQHYLEYVESGAAERIIHSPSITNISANKSPLTEGTLLYPFRHPQWNLSLMRGESIYVDSKIARTFSMREPALEVLGNKDTENYVYYIGRHEPTRKGYSTWGYAAGLIFDKPSARALRQELYVPFAGIEVADLKLIEKHLAEIAVIAVEKSLDIIDPLTLSEGHGQIIGYEDSDYPEYSVENGEPEQEKDAE